MRLKGLFQILKETNADFIFLQEVTTKFVHKLCELDWVREQYFVPDVEGKTVSPYGIFMLSKFPISSVHSHKLHTRMRRRVLISDTLINGEPIRLSTVHLESLSISSSTRRDQLKSIFPMLDGTPNAIFAGDFNFCANSSEEKKQIEESKFADVWSTLKPDELGQTIGINYPAPLYPPARFDRLLYYSKKWMPVDVKLLGTEPIGSFAFSGENIYPSDHYGIQSKFVYSPKGE